MVAVLTGRGDRASVRVTYPAPMRSSSRIRCTHALNERQVREGPGEVPKVPAAVRFYLPGVQRQRAGVGRQLLAQRPGARLASPISVSAKTTAAAPRRNSARPPSKPSMAPADLRTSVAEVGRS
jgi:hypothetical protein